MEARTRVRARARRTRRPLLWASEKMAQQLGYSVIAGIDEVGMGPLAGPAVAAAVVLPWRVKLPGLHDSKKLTAEQRRRLDRQIRRVALAFSICSIEASEIDRLGLTMARRLAMAGAVQGLAIEPEYLLIDAFDLPESPLPQMAVIKGDATCASIMAASVIAKVHRDTAMIEYDRQFPGYGFAEHKGYATSSHRRALRQLGPSPIHRMSWAPLRALLG
jgi:ribonuclease HII